MIIKVLLEAPEEALGTLEREAILYVALKVLSAKF
jgi:hypothetical protein